MGLGWPPRGGVALDLLHGRAIRDGEGGSFTASALFLLWVFLALEALALASERSSLIACFATSAFGISEPRPFLTFSEEKF
jgi:hypothetical protein